MGLHSAAIQQILPNLWPAASKVIIQRLQQRDSQVAIYIDPKL